MQKKRDFLRENREQMRRAQEEQHEMGLSCASTRSSPGCKRGRRALRLPESLPLESFILEVARALDREVHSVEQLRGEWAEKLQMATSVHRALESELMKVHSRRRFLEERTNAIRARLLQLQAMGIGT